MEIGPYRVKGDNLVFNNGTWNQFANLLFVDNPVGTGFSYVDTNAYLHELDEMADEFVAFLEKWFELFPQYKEDEVRARYTLRSSMGLTFVSYTLPASPTLVSISHTSPSTFSNATRRLRTSGTSAD